MFLFEGCEGETVTNTANDEAVVVVTVTEDFGEEDCVPLKSFDKKEMKIETDT